jgi:hypothetical protein
MRTEIAERADFSVESDDCQLDFAEGRLGWPVAEVVRVHDRMPEMSKGLMDPSVALQRHL